TYLHELAGLTFTVPPGWKEIKPSRLSRKIDPRVNTVLRLDDPERDMTVAIYWLPLAGSEKVADWVREGSGDREYGEEYETLKTIYGGQRVSLPTRVRSIPFEPYRISIKSSTESGLKYDGALFLFEVGAGRTTFLVRLRFMYPAGDSLIHEQAMMDVLKGFAKAPRS
ncbi:MAG: hypothetical protein NZM29_09100, partial [Nitrospira sp.]|nr:hypothetical protein [Nitrospira sp.]